MKVPFVIPISAKLSFLFYSICVLLELGKPYLRQYVPVSYQFTSTLVQFYHTVEGVICLYYSTDSDVTVSGTSLSTLWPSK